MRNFIKEFYVDKIDSGLSINFIAKELQRIRIKLLGAQQIEACKNAARPF